MYLVIGANGRTGRHLVHHLRLRDEPVRAFVRSPDHAARFTALGAEVYIGNLDDGFDDAFDDIDIVIYAAGSAESEGAEEERAYDRDAIMTVTDLCLKFSVDQLVIISALTAFERNAADDVLKHYREMKYEGDQYVRESGQSYLIIGPTTLTDDAAVGAIALHDRQSGELPPVTREDTALVAIDALAAGLRNLNIGFSGGNVAIKAALDTLA